MNCPMFPGGYLVRQSSTLVVQEDGPAVAAAVLPHHAVEPGRRLRINVATGPPNFGAPVFIATGLRYLRVIH